MVEGDGNLKPEFEKEQKMGNTTFKVTENNKNKNDNKTIFNWQQDSRLKIKKGLRIRLDCEFCKGPILAHPHVFRFANYERFFCCKWMHVWLQAKVCRKNRVNKKKICR